MQQNLSCAIITASFAFAPCALGQTTAPTRPGLPQDARPWSFWGNLPIIIEVIEPIALKDIARYSDMLLLSAEQRHYAEFMFETEYLPQIVKIDDKHSARLKPMGERFADPQLPESREFAEFFTTWRGEEEAVCDAVEAADRFLLDAIAATLSDDQRLLMPRVLWNRARGQCVRRAAFPVARIDLSKMLSELAIPRDSLADIDRLIAGYEERITPLRRRADQIYRSNRVRLEVGIVNLQFAETGTRRDPSAPETQQIRAELHALRDTLRRQQIAADSDCAKLNESTLVQLVSALPAAEASRLQQRYLASAYPRVYPDSLDPQGLMNRILTDPFLDAEHTEVIVTHWRDYRGEYQRICREMEKASRSWQEYVVRTDGFDGAAAHNKLMGDLFERRLAAGRKCMTLIRSLLPDEARTAIAPAIDQWESHVSRETPRLLRRVTMNRPD